MTRHVGDVTHPFARTVRREVLGDEYADRALEKSRSSAFGVVWQLRAAPTHAAAYAGAPARVEGFRVADEVWGERCALASSPIWN